MAGRPTGTRSLVSGAIRADIEGVPRFRDGQDQGAVDGRPVNDRGGATPHEVTAASEVAAVPAAGSVLADDGPATTGCVAHTSVHAIGSSDNRVVPAPAVAPTDATSLDTARTYVTPVKPRRLYLSVAAKFTLAMAFAVAWVGLSVWISAGWVRDLTPVT